MHRYWLMSSYKMIDQQMDGHQICADSVLGEIKANLFNSLYDIAEHMHLNRTLLQQLWCQTNSCLRVRFYAAVTGSLHASCQK